MLSFQRMWENKSGNVLIPEGPPVTHSTHAGNEEWGAKEGSQRAAHPLPLPAEPPRQGGKRLSSQCSWKLRCEDYTRPDVLTSALSWPFVIASEQKSHGWPETSLRKGAGKAANPQSSCEQGKDAHVPKPLAPPTCAHLSGNIMKLLERMKWPCE